MSSFKITAIGEILYDIYPDKKRLGGAPFNFIYHVWKIIETTNFISSVGSDENGNEIIAHLSSIGFNTSYISIDKDHPTGTVHIKLRKDKTPQFTISPMCSYDYITLNDKIKQLVEKETDLLYFGTLSQRFITTRNTTQSLLSKKIKYFCDLNLRHNFFSKEIIRSALSSSNLVKVSYDELKIINRFIYDGIVSENILIQKLINDFEIDLFCVTLGADGALLASQNEINKYSVKINYPVDTVGAGDAYAAILCLGYLYGFQIAEINKLANEFAAEICIISGALPESDSIYTKYKNIFSGL